MARTYDTGIDAGAKDEFVEIHPRQRRRAEFISRCIETKMGSPKPRVGESKPAFKQRYREAQAACRQEWLNDVAKRHAIAVAEDNVQQAKEQLKREKRG